MKSNKTSQLLLRISEEELEQIQENARYCGKTVSAYIRETALNMAIINIDNEMVEAHTNEIVAYKNAINQLVFTIKKTGGYDPVDLEYILEKTRGLLSSEKKFLIDFNKFSTNIKEIVKATVQNIVKENQDNH